MLIMASKQAEQQAVDDLKELYADFPEGGIQPHEEPDFLVGKRVGIEVTEYFRPEATEGTSPQAQEALQYRVAEAAESVWRARGYPPCVVNVIFRRHSRLGKRNVQEIAEELVILAAQSVTTGRALRSEQLPDDVESLTVYEYKQLAWLVTGALFPPMVDEAELRRIIDKKETKLPQYRKAAPENWLLIVVSGGRRSSLSELPESFTPIDSAFERVILLFERRKAVRIA